MNSYGRIFRISIFGESHSDFIGINIDGCPSGIDLRIDDFLKDIERRKGGIKGTTQRKEDDIPEIISGIFNFKTTGAPITILFRNKDFRKDDYEKFIDTPRPGHSDFVAMKKFNSFNDYRGGGHFSGRLTLALVAAGVIAKKIITNIIIKAYVLEICGETDLEKGLQKAISSSDSVGGIIECTSVGIPISLGEPFFDSVESLISHLVFSIPAVKGIEFGSGFKSAKMFGSQHNDCLVNLSGETKTNNSGGVSGGLTNGNELVFRVAIKPTPSTPKEQQTLNIRTNSIESLEIKGRHDLCIALRVPVIIEAITAIALTDLYLLKTYNQND